VIYGAPVTGKTTMLQTLMLSAAMTYRPDQVHMYVMDFGGWNMNLLADLPHVGGIANDNEPERIQKLILLLQEILEERKLRFSKAGVGNINAFREVTRGKIADIILLVDNFGPVLKLYPDLDVFFGTLTSSGANYGMYLVATASASNAVPNKISQNIKNAIALQMIEKSDYTYLVGKVSDQLPAIAGRGFCKGTPPLMFQAALPVSGEGVRELRNQIRHRVDAMMASWKGSLPQPIPELPERIPYGSVSSEGIALGLSVEKVTPVSYDLAKQHYLLISGTAQSGKSSLLQVVTRQMMEKLNGQLYVFDVKNSGLTSIRSMAAKYLSNAQQIDQFIEQLRPELQDRLSRKQADPNAVFTPIVMVVDDYERFFSAVSNDTVARLNAIIKIGTGLGLYLIAAGDAYGMASLVNKGEAVAHAMSHSKQLVMLGGCMNDHCTVSVKASYSQKNEVLNEKEGFFIGTDGIVRFKTMEPHREVTG